MSNISLLSLLDKKRIEKKPSIETEDKENMSQAVEVKTKSCYLHPPTSRQTPTVVCYRSSICFNP